MAPRLTSLPSRFARLAPRVGVLAREGKRDRSAAPWRAWYSTKRWRELRLKVLERDGYICQRSGAACSGISPEPNSPVVNHRIPHRGDAALFWDETNLETVTKQVHDTIIQAEEQGSLHRRGDWG